MKNLISSGLLDFLRWDPGTVPKRRHRTTNLLHAICRLHRGESLKSCKFRDVATPPSPNPEYFVTAWCYKSQRIPFV